MINMTAAHATGALHVAVYDFANQFVYVASASNSSVQPTVYAYERAFCRVDLRRSWAEQRPASPQFMPFDGKH